MGLETDHRKWVVGLGSRALVFAEKSQLFGIAINVANETKIILTIECNPLRSHSHSRSEMSLRLVVDSETVQNPG